MTRDQIAAAVTLADTLTRENAALKALDLAGAATLLTEKQRACGVFDRVQRAAAGAMAASLDREQRRLAEDMAARLHALAQENRRLLERAIRIQGRVVATVARAVPKALAPAARYGATGAFAAAPTARPVIVSSRV